MSNDNELIESLKAWSEHFTPEKHPVALTLNRARAELTAAKQQLDEVTKQRDGLVTACRALLMSPEVQGAWPLDGSKRAQKPSDTYSKAEAKVKFRHLLKIHSIIEKGGES